MTHTGEEEADDGGGPRREFFTCFFEEAQQYLMEETKAYTFLKDYERRNIGEYEVSRIRIPFAKYFTHFAFLCCQISFNKLHNKF